MSAKKITRTLVLSRTKNKYAEELAAGLSNGKVIYDDSVDDKEMSRKGFLNMTKSIKSPCSWEKSFHYLSENPVEIENFDRFAFIEDDVFSKNTDCLRSFEEKVHDLDFDILTHYISGKEESKGWHWWVCEDKKYFKNPIKSFNPFCILSRRLVRSILDFRSNENKFMFHEIMFCSVAASSDYKMVSLESLPFYKDYFGRFEWRPIMKEENIKDERIYHPVKPSYK